MNDDSSVMVLACLVTFVQSFMRKTRMDLDLWSGHAYLHEMSLLCSRANSERNFCFLNLYLNIYKSHFNIKYNLLSGSEPEAHGPHSLTSVAIIAYTGQST